MGYISKYEYLLHIFRTYRLIYHALGNSLISQT